MKIGHFFGKINKVASLDIALALIIAFVICLSTASAHAQSSTDYTKAQIPVPVTMATVLQVRNVSLEASTSSKVSGGLLGGALGALLAARTAKSGNPNAYVITAALGSLGAMGGSLVAEKVATTKSQEIVYVQDDGKAFAVAQSSDDGVVFFPGQKVIILNGRVAPAIR